MEGEIILKYVAITIASLCLLYGLTNGTGKVLKKMFNSFNTYRDDGRDQLFFYIVPMLIYAYIILLIISKTIDLW